MSDICSAANWSLFDILVEGVGGSRNETLWNIEADGYCSSGSKVHLVQNRSTEQAVGIGELVPNFEMIVALHDQ
jgi:hypothetical protein